MMCLQEFIKLFISILIVGKSGVVLRLKVPQANGKSTVGIGKD